MNANAEYRLAALPFIAATRFHLALLIRLLEFALRHLAFVLCHLAFAICHLTFPIPRSEFPIPHSLKRFQRPQQLPRLGRLVASVPLERHAAIQRRAVGPSGVLDRFDGLGFWASSSSRPADVLCDDRGEYRPRLHRIPGSGSNLTPLQPVVIGQYR